MHCIFNDCKLDCLHRGLFHMPLSEPHSDRGLTSIYPAIWLVLTICYRLSSPCTWAYLLLTYKSHRAIHERTATRIPKHIQDCTSGLAGILAAAEHVLELIHLVDMLTQSSSSYSAASASSTSRTSHISCLAATKRRERHDVPKQQTTMQTSRIKKFLTSEETCSREQRQQGERDSPRAEDPPKQLQPYRVNLLPL